MIRDGRAVHTSKISEQRIIKKILLTTPLRTLYNSTTDNRFSRGAPWIIKEALCWGEGGLSWPLPGRSAGSCFREADPCTPKFPRSGGLCEIWKEISLRNRDRWGIPRSYAEPPGIKPAFSGGLRGGNNPYAEWIGWEDLSGMHATEKTPLEKYQGLLRKSMQLAIQRPTRTAFFFWSG